MLLYRDVNNLPKPEARRCWRSSTWDLRHGHLGPGRRKVPSVEYVCSSHERCWGFFLGENDPRLPNTLGLEVFGPQTHTIQTHPQATLGGYLVALRHQTCRWILTSLTSYLFALTKNNSTGRLVDEGSFKQARVVV